MAIKVKQSTINEIKKMGMTKALAAAKTRRSAEYQEAVKRMYGARRVSKATAGSGRSTQPAGGVMGTKRAQVMAGPVRSTMKKTSAMKKTSGNTVTINGKKYTPAAAEKYRKDKGLTKSTKRSFKNNKSFKEFMGTKTKKFGTPN
jgi:hypothetical protein